VCNLIATRLSTLPPPLSWPANFIVISFVTRLQATFFMPLALRLPSRLSLIAAVLTAAGDYRADPCSCNFFKDPDVRAFIDRGHLAAALFGPPGAVALAAVPVGELDRCRVAVTFLLLLTTLTSLLLAKVPGVSDAAWATPADRAVERTGARLLAWLSAGGAPLATGHPVRWLGLVGRVWLLLSLIWWSSTLLVTTLWPL
jgi:hypothetical protein